MKIETQQPKSAVRRFVPVRMKVLDVINPHMPNRAGRWVHANAASVWSDRFGTKD